MEQQSDEGRELTELLKAAYAAGKAAERPFDKRRPEDRKPVERDDWHH
jgi:hypothetical protein